jgi:hypothetical protein
MCIKKTCYFSGLRRNFSHCNQTPVSLYKYTSHNLFKTSKIRFGPIVLSFRLWKLRAFFYRDFFFFFFFFFFVLHPVYFRQYISPAAKNSNKNTRPEIPKSAIKPASIGHWFQNHRALLFFDSAFPGLFFFFFFSPSKKNSRSIQNSQKITETTNFFFFFFFFSTLLHQF